VIAHAAEPRPDPLDDLRVGLGEYVMVAGAGLGMALNVARSIANRVWMAL
jgi:hypothetical protein